MINVFLTCNLHADYEQLFQGQNRSSTQELGSPPQNITSWGSPWSTLPRASLEILLISILKDKLVSTEEKVIFNAYSILTVFHSIQNSLLFFQTLKHFKYSTKWCLLGITHYLQMTPGQKVQQAATSWRMAFMEKIVHSLISFSLY